MENLAFVVVALGILGFGLFSEKLQKSIFTPPIVFVLFGLIVSAQGFGGVDLHLDEHLIHTLAEITLVLVLFTDASRIDLGLLRREHDLPVRLLSIGMPLTVILGTIVATLLFPGFTFWEAALLAAVLAPTDAALGQAVVSSPLVPVRIRQTLNVESGLNDGIALPLVLVFLSMCSSAIEGQGGTEFWLKFAFLQVTLGPVVGVAVGWLGGRAVQAARDRGWMSHSFVRLSALGLALLAFSGAEVIGGNGFIAAFCAGLAMGNTAKRLSEAIYEFAEAEGQLLTLLVFLVFGATLLPEVLHHFHPRYWLYGLLSLTVIRMLPVVLSLLGTGLRKETVFFLGWFGPRGVASILFGLLVVSRSVLVAKEEIFMIVLATVALSVLAHGVTAYPGVKWYSRHSETLPAEEAPEHQDVEEMPVRVRHS
jgi:NhaP-type Na+/H+ or K+/H+ antiporter